MIHVDMHRESGAKYSAYARPNIRGLITLHICTGAPTRSPEVAFYGTPESLKDLLVQALGSVSNCPVSVRAEEE